MKRGEFLVVSKHRIIVRGTLQANVELRREFLGSLRGQCGAKSYSDGVAPDRNLST